MAISKAYHSDEDKKLYDKEYERIFGKKDFVKKKIKKVEVASSKKEKIKKMV